jgi:hypothetical protein
VSITNRRSGNPPATQCPERAVELIALALEREPLLLGVALGLPEESISSSLRRREIDWEMVFQLVSVPPSQRELI